MSVILHSGSKEPGTSPVLKSCLIAGHAIPKLHLHCALMLNIAFYLLPSTKCTFDNKGVTSDPNVTFSSFTRMLFLSDDTESLKKLRAIQCCMISWLISQECQCINSSEDRKSLLQYTHRVYVPKWPIWRQRISW